MDWAHGRAIGVRADYPGPTIVWDWVCDRVTVLGCEFSEWRTVRIGHVVMLR